MKFKIVNAVIVFYLCGCATSERFSRGDVDNVAKKIRFLKKDCLVCGAKMFSSKPGDIDADSLDSDLKTFHHYGIQNHAESYLVCMCEVEKTGGPKNEAEIKATVVDRIKGDKKVGEKLFSGA